MRHPAEILKSQLYSRMTTAANLVASWLWREISILQFVRAIRRRGKRHRIHIAMVWSTVTSPMRRSPGLRCSPVVMVQVRGCVRLGICVSDTHVYTQTYMSCNYIRVYLIEQCSGRFVAAFVWGFVYQIHMCIHRHTCLATTYGYILLNNVPAGSWLRSFWDVCRRYICVYTDIHRHVFQLRADIWYWIMHLRVRGCVYWDMRIQHTCVCTWRTGPTAYKRVQTTYVRMCTQKKTYVHTCKCVRGWVRFAIFVQHAYVYT